MITTIKNQAMIETPTVLTGYLVDGTKNVPLSTGNRTYQEVQRAINGTDEYLGNPIIPEPAYTDSEILASSQSTKISEIKDTHTSMDMIMWSATSTANLDKKKADTSVRISELQELTRTPEQDAELTEYFEFFGYSKQLNRDEHTFVKDIEELDTPAEVDAYVYSFTPMPQSDARRGRSANSISDAQWFVRHGYEQA